MLLDDIGRAMEALEKLDGHIGAFLPEADRRQRIEMQCEALVPRFPSPAQRPPLYGIPLGVKDLFTVDGLPTRAGSRLPAEAFEGPQASVVSRLIDAGALVLGKTTTDEFAYGDPPVTRNPRSLEHSPGGSSAGSAAAVAAEICPLALGTQTSRSIIAPAAWCGVYGFKPSLGRVPTDGIVLLSSAMDTAGLLARDLDILEKGLKVLLNEHRVTQPDGLRLGVPTGVYMNHQPDLGWRAHYEAAIATIRQAGIEVTPIDLGWDERLQQYFQACMDTLHGEMSRLHRARIKRWGDRYQRRSRAGVERGELIDDNRLREARQVAEEVRGVIHHALDQGGIDCLISPSQPAPPSLLGERTGWGSTTIPWSFAGVPCASVPWGTMEGLPAGLQLITRHGDDEKLLDYLRVLDGVRPCSAKENARTRSTTKSRG